MAGKIKNYTFSLPIDLIEKYKEFAGSDYIDSVNSAVKEALQEYAVKIEKEKLRTEMLMAAKDPMFIRDLEESMRAFEPSDAETAGRNEEW